VIGRVSWTWCLPLAAALAMGLSGCASSSKSDRGSNIPTGWPVDPGVASVSSPFGARRSGAWHQGIDLSAPKGTPVRATAAGRVVVAERSGDYGRTVVIDHGDGLRTRYAHLRRIAVEQGERVKTGEVIGEVGKSGNASGPHVHYEVVRNGTPVDPWPFMDGR
jgi:murein DD-endopeptidase MepM/ murein hydrolase activator NlpD